MSSAEEVRAKGELASACMLQQSFATVIGVAVGLAIGLRTKSVKPFLLTSISGTAADLAVGSFYACRSELDDFNACRLAFERGKQANEEAERKRRDGKAK